MKRPRQPALFPLTPLEAKREALDRVEAHAAPEWLTMAEVAVTSICRHRKQFTMDAVWGLLDKWQVPLPRERRAMGAVMRRAVRDGICRPLPEHHQSVRAINHARPLRIWESLLDCPANNGGRDAELPPHPDRR